MPGKYFILYALLITGAAMAGGESSVIAHSYVIRQDAPVIKYTPDKASVIPQQKKYIQINISKVINPELESLSFTVYIEPADQHKKVLGSFSLFPPNNPGTFIVPTQNKLVLQKLKQSKSRSPNAIFISLDSNTELNKQVQVFIESILLVNRIEQ